MDSTQLWQAAVFVLFVTAPLTYAAFRSIFFDEDILWRTIGLAVALLWFGTLMLTLNHLYKG